MTRLTEPHRPSTAREMDDATRNLEDLKLTPDEVQKFETAFKDPEFKKMFAEYAKEISDPKNKAESDAYLRQLEYENKVESVYGKGVQLVIPTAGFVVKTADDADGKKVFLNVCHSDKCEDAKGSKVAGGMQWQVPHTLGGCHEETDKSGAACDAYDFVVSTHTFELCQRDDRIRNMVVETAIEAVNTAHDRKCPLKYTLPKKTFVGPKTGPGVQAIRDKGDKSQKGLKQGEGKVTPGGRIAPKGAPAGAPSGKEAPEPANNASAFSFDKAVKRPDTSPDAKEPEGECEPKYSITHRDEGSDLSKGFGRGNSSNEVSKRRDTRPKHLVVRVTTPKIESIAGAELDVSERRLFFQVPGKYRLDIPLPFEVDGDEGKAKFDKSSRRLEVTLPVKPAKVEPPLRFTEPRMTEEDAKVDANVEEKPLVEEIPPADEVSEEEDPVASAPAVKVDDAEARAAASAAAAVAAKREFEDRRGETENQRVWREMHEKRAPEPKPALPPEPEPVDVGDDVDGFMSAARFAGAKQGYVYKKDDRGLGYYVDKPKQKQPAASAPKDPAAVPSPKPRSTVPDVLLNPEPKSGRATEPALDDSDAEDEEWNEDKLDDDFLRVGGDVRRGKAIASMFSCNIDDELD